MRASETATAFTEESGFKRATGAPCLERVGAGTERDGRIGRGARGRSRGEDQYGLWRSGTVADWGDALKFCFISFGDLLKSPIYLSFM